MKKYRYKLNMLEPGCKMIKAIGILGVSSFALYLCKAHFLCFIVSGIAILIFIILLILLIIEGHQDKVLNEQAIKERREDGED